MSNPSKQKGTRGETSVVRFLLAADIKAERRALAGSNDKGDILLPDHNIILEVKAGKQTANYSRTTKDVWLRQTQIERKNAKASKAYLVICIYRRAVRDYEVWSEDGREFWYLDEFVNFIS